MSQPRISIDNALQEYYKLKDQYDKTYDSKKHTIISDITIPYSKKKAKIAELSQKRKCVVCKAAGGTIFTNENRVLKAVCGSKSQPCGLNIEIARGKKGNIEKLITLSYKKIEDIKENIIKFKLDLLFRYISDDQLKQKFDESKKELETELAKYEKIYNIYIDNTNSPERMEKLKELNAELYTYVEQFKGIMKEYMETSRIEVVKPAIEIYLNYIVPIAEKIRNTTYVYSGIEYDENTNEYLLIQQISNIKKSEVNIERPQVISFAK
jgi:hypothetical protein